MTTKAREGVKKPNIYPRRGLWKTPKIEIELLNAMQGYLLFSTFIFCKMTMPYSQIFRLWRTIFRCGCTENL